MTSGPTRIEWYSGHTLYDRPRRLLWKNRWLEVLSVLQRGYTPNGAFVKLLASDQGLYLLEYSLDQDCWSLVHRLES
jgi:hypothetical protein